MSLQNRCYNTVVHTGLCVDKPFTGDPTPQTRKCCQDPRRTGVKSQTSLSAMNISTSNTLLAFVSGLIVARLKALTECYMTFNGPAIWNFRTRQPAASLIGHSGWRPAIRFWSECFRNIQWSGCHWQMYAATEWPVWMQLRGMLC